MRNDGFRLMGKAIWRWWWWRREGVAEEKKNMYYGTLATISRFSKKLCFIGLGCILTVHPHLPQRYAFGLVLLY